MGAFNWDDCMCEATEMRHVLGGIDRSECNEGIAKMVAEGKRLQARVEELEADLRENLVTGTDGKLHHHECMGRYGYRCKGWCPSYGAPTAPREAAQICRRCGYFCFPPICTKCATPTESRELREGVDSQQDASSGPAITPLPRSPTESTGAKTYQGVCRNRSCRKYFYEGPDRPPIFCPECAQELDVMSTGTTPTSEEKGE